MGLCLCDVGFLFGRKQSNYHWVSPFYRYLHIVLYLAERAWSYATELKQASGNASSRRRTHLIRRLAKAARWADLFSQLCTSKADPRTALEAAVSDFQIPWLNWWCCNFTPINLFYLLLHFSCRLHSGCGKLNQLTDSHCFLVARPTLLTWQAASCSSEKMTGTKRWEILRMPGITTVVFDPRFGTSHFFRLDQAGFKSWYNQGVSTRPTDSSTGSHLLSG